jgi:hypothetical protein
VTTPVLRPNNELVTTAFLVSIVGDRVATTLPKDIAGWAEDGFVTVDTVGGTPNIYLPIREPVMGVQCWAVNPNSQKPPWNKAASLAGAIQDACWDHPAVPRNLVLLGGYPMVQVKSAYLTGEPRRVPDDPSSYARYSIPGLVVVWTVMQP